jgi:hypothetical protein
VWVAAMLHGHAHAVVGPGGHLQRVVGERVAVDHQRVIPRRGEWAEKRSQFTPQRTQFTLHSSRHQRMIPRPGECAEIVGG